MGEISVSKGSLDRLLTDSTSTCGSSFQQAFADLARTHRGRPAAEIRPLLARAAQQGSLGFSSADLWEQARAISGGAPYVLRVTVT
ncbi:hypothetical protein [Streptomyces sp. cmx-4-9]|uniref:hypothetical protein n=1 Tax=Streptomyces sp. cmx-4-9 TaxID=2790941 RepID=UPI00398173F6